MGRVGFEASLWVEGGHLGLASALFGPARGSAQEADSLRQLAEPLETVERQLEALKSEKVSPTSISGYMDFHYNDLQPGGERLDFHRFVLLVAHEFSEDIRFYSELEVEHAFIKDGQGEVELEQAFVEIRLLYQELEIKPARDLDQVAA